MEGCCLVNDIEFQDPPVALGAGGWTLNSNRLIVLNFREHEKYLEIPKSVWVGWGGRCHLCIFNQLSFS